jgi:hypothetical protein
VYVLRPGDRTKEATLELCRIVSKAADLCSSFLHDTLANVDVVVKTGISEHRSLEAILSSYRSCISYMLIVCDTPDIVQGQHVHDILVDLPTLMIFASGSVLAGNLFASAQQHNSIKIAKSETASSVCSTLWQFLEWPHLNPQTPDRWNTVDRGHRATRSLHEVCNVYWPEPSVESSRSRKDDWSSPWSHSRYAMAHCLQIRSLLSQHISSPQGYFA